MFGFLRGDASDREYRQVYAGCCSAQHRLFGIGSLLFHSYEATFLYLLAIDSGAAPHPEARHATCCRLRRNGEQVLQVEPQLAKYCASFALLLAKVKLTDDIADDRSLPARIAQWKLAGRMSDAACYLESQHPGLEAFVVNCLAEHARLEHTGTALSLARYVEPTSNAFGEVFHGFECLLRTNAEAATSNFRQIGQAIGAAIIAFDCAVDWRRDRQRGRFNPLGSREEVQSALKLCQHELVKAGWLCHELFGEQAFSTRTLRKVFARVSHRTESLAHDAPRAGLWQRLKGHGRRQLRYGFCDCDCPLGGGCCDIDGTWCGDTCCCCDVCIAPCDTGASKKKGKRDPQELIGQVGVAVGKLDPEGVVLIGKERYPAKSVAGTIEELISVEVVGHDSFGVLVQRAQLKEKKYGL